MDSMIGRLRVFLPDLLDNCVYLQILSSFKQTPLNRAIVINMQQSADDDSGDESPKAAKCSEIGVRVARAFMG